VKIVLPFDGSPASNRAVQYVIGLSEKLTDKQLTVDVVNAQEGARRAAEIFTRDAAEIAAKIVESSRETGNRVLQSALKSLEDAKITAKPFVILGEPADAVAEHIAKHGGDAVVMGTRGLGAVGGLVLGSVAGKIIHLVKVPVTLVK